jgi:hypothetical protein
MKYLSFLLLIPFQVCSQSFEKLDSILKIQHIPLNESEIRIYKDYSTSTGLELFRLYKDENNVFQAEFHQTVARKIGDNTEIRVKKDKLNSIKNMEVIWLAFLNSDIGHLPPFSEIVYKFRDNKDLELKIIDGEITYLQISKPIILDGVTFMINFSSPKMKNQIVYDNPESYLNLFPNVDELISFQEILEIARTEFNLFNN